MLSMLKARYITHVGNFITVSHVTCQWAEVAVRTVGQHPQHTRSLTYSCHLQLLVTFE